MDGENILTIDQLVAVFPAFGEKTIRWWIYNGKSNGFEACLIRIGSRIYIDRARFVAWIKKHRRVPDMPSDEQERRSELEDIE